MISFRFHVVSIVAVFLALAIGIVVGSTVIDRAIVETLRSRVDEVSDNLDERQAANDRLEERVDQLQAYATELAPLAVQGRLPRAVTVVVVDRGVDRGPVDRTVELLDDAGSAVRGILTLDGSWDLEDEERRTALAEAIDLDPDAAVEDLQARAASLLVTDLSSVVEVAGDDTGALDEISDLELVDFEAIDPAPAPRPRQVYFVVVSGPESDVEGIDHAVHFAAAAAESTGGAVLAEVWAERDDGPDRADSLARVLGSPTLAAEISTVDDLDLAPGPATTVLALVALRGGDVGHFGVGDGAEATVPASPEEP